MEIRKRNFWERFKMAVWLLFSNKPLIDLYETGLKDGANNTVKDFCKIKQTLVPLLQELAYPSLCEHMIAPPNCQELELIQHALPSDVIHNIVSCVPEEPVEFKVCHYQAKVVTYTLRENAMIRQMYDAARLSAYIESEKRNAAACLAKKLIDEGFMISRKMASINPHDVCVNYSVLTYNKV